MQLRLPPWAALLDHWSDRFSAQSVLWGHLMLFLLIIHFYLLHFCDWCLLNFSLFQHFDFLNVYLLELLDIWRLYFLWTWYAHLFEGLGFFGYIFILWRMSTIIVTRIAKFDAIILEIFDCNNNRIKISLDFILWVSQYTLVFLSYDIVRWIFSLRMFNRLDEL